LAGGGVADDNYEIWDKVVEMSVRLIQCKHVYVQRALTGKGQYCCILYLCVSLCSAACEADQMSFMCSLFLILACSLHDVKSPFEKNGSNHCF
jgi:hypothetical protein